MFYYMYKIYRIIVSYIVSNSFAPGVLYCFGTESPKVVYLDHTNASIMHLGDLLFFLEVVLCCKRSNIAVFLVGSDALLPLFKLFGVSHIASLKDLTPGLILTKDDALSQYRSTEMKRHTVLGFNFWKLRGSEPVASLVSREFCSFCRQYVSGFLLVNKEDVLEDINVALDQIPSVDDGSRFGEAFVFLDNESYVFVNSFVQSQKISTVFRKALFNRLVEDHKSKGAGTFVCIGSLQDKRVRLGYEVDIDLRGTLSIDQLLGLFASGSVTKVITFDTFIAHLAVLFNVELHLIFKSGLRKRIIKDRFVPFLDSSNKQAGRVFYY
jgi:hypothetical protein